MLQFLMRSYGIHYEDNDSSPAVEQETVGLTILAICNVGSSGPAPKGFPKHSHLLEFHSIK